MKQPDQIGTHDAVAPTESRRGSREVTTDRSEMRTLDGDHFHFRAHGAQILRMAGELLSSISHAPHPGMTRALLPFLRMALAGGFPPGASGPRRTHPSTAVPDPRPPH